MWIMENSAGGGRFLLELPYEPYGLWGGSSRRVTKKEFMVRPRNERAGTSLWLGE